MQCHHTVTAAVSRCRSPACRGPSARSHCHAQLTYAWWPAQAPGRYHRRTGPRMLLAVYAAPRPGLSSSPPRAPRRMPDAAPSSSRTPGSRSPYKLLDVTPRCAGPDVAFMTLLSGERYVPGALCLAHALRMVGSACPIRLVIDDRPAAPLSAGSLRRLKAAYTQPHLRTSELMARIAAYNKSFQIHSPPKGWREVGYVKLMVWAISGCAPRRDLLADDLLTSTYLPADLQSGHALTDI